MTFLWMPWKSRPMKVAKSRYGIISVSYERDVLISGFCIPPQCNEYDEDGERNDCKEFCYPDQEVAARRKKPGGDGYATRH